MYFGSNNDLGCEELILVTEKIQNNMTTIFLIYNVEHALIQIKTFEHQSCETFSLVTFGATEQHCIWWCGRVYIPLKRLVSKLPAPPRSVDSQQLGVLSDSRS